MSETNIIPLGLDSHPHGIDALSPGQLSDNSKGTALSSQFWVSLIDQVAEASAHFSSLGAIGLCGAFA
jgi:hypothetical protein